MANPGAQVGSPEVSLHIERWKASVVALVSFPPWQYQELARHQRAPAAAIPTPKGHKRMAPMDIDISLTG